MFESDMGARSLLSAFSTLNYHHFMKKSEKVTIESRLSPRRTLYAKGLVGLFFAF